METNNLSECTFFMRRNQLVSYYTLLDNGEGLELRLSDLNQNGLCIIEDADSLVELVNKRAVISEKVKQREEFRNKAIKQLLKGKSYYPTPQAAFNANPSEKIDFEKINQIYNKLIQEYNQSNVLL